MSYLQEAMEIAMQENLDMTVITLDYVQHFGKETDSHENIEVTNTITGKQISCDKISILNSYNFMLAYVRPYEISSSVWVLMYGTKLKKYHVPCLFHSTLL